MGKKYFNGKLCNNFFQKNEVFCKMFAEQRKFSYIFMIIYFGRSENIPSKNTSLDKIYKSITFTYAYLQTSLVRFILPKIFFNDFNLLVKWLSNA